ncbi:HNH endonuclease signature motif containing protein [Mycolicibacterium sp. NCC-Tsukiji]|uniref:HNH endonuclease signature motif containing protein n=1 Tax=Mycolicibacterium sp. NCC-Tsukiji TaxID=2185272 RepID=UPI000EDA6323|nr:HNH endonuclease signature motif containing protein [Mycolicibacterium sp. NCC-Tsukiji]GCA96655.1 HNH endonuclease [Mycolicibacterium sp. NCC-Tsukiji]
MFEHSGVGAGGVLVHDVGVVDLMIHFARVENQCAAGRLTAIADLAMLRVDDQDGRQWWACDGWDAAVAEVGAALGLGKREASGQLSIAVALRFRLPKVAAVFADGGVSARTVGTICWRTRLVENPNTLAVIDAALAGALSEWAGLSRKKIETKIDGWVQKFDPAAVLKVRSAARRRGVGVGKPDDETGVASIWGALLATDAELLDRVLTEMARQVCENDPRTFGQRRADALGVLAARGDRLACQCGNPDCPAAGPDARATAVMIHVLTNGLPAPVADPLLSGDPAAPLVPTPAPSAPEPVFTPEPVFAPAPAPAAEPANDMASTPMPMSELAPVPESAPASAPARVPAPVRTPVGYVLGGGVVPPTVLADLVARGAKVRSVASASDLDEVPRYRPSVAMDEFVRMRAMTCMFPGCDHPATASDIDHTVPWPAGPTHPGNLNPKCRKHHLLKTFYGGPGGWQDRQQPDGTIVWTAPTGHTYISVPESRILFPRTITDTPLPNPPPETVGLDTATAPGRSIMMPIRRRTRAQDQAQRNAYERALNQADIDAQEAAREAFARQRREREEWEAAEAAAAAESAGQQDIPPPR